MIELATAKDRAEVNRLARQIHQLHVDWRPDIYQMPEELFSEEQFQELIGTRQMYVGKLNGIVVGYAILKIREYNWPAVVYRRVMVLDQLCVEETLRGHGLGTAMMEDIRALAKAFGCTDMQLGVYPQNDAAVSFYQKCGFMIQNINMQRKI
ncbi:MAG: GNAT family N-acetyltransferase [Oscillospiraceae bacterium]|nr:GNAT family N-acetyltransferase [Oscillospiraceae bacterium]